MLPSAAERRVALLDGRPEITAFVEIKRQSLKVFGHDEVVSRVLETLSPCAAAS